MNANRKQRRAAQSKQRLKDKRMARLKKRMKELEARE
ncbi:hypothetical protein MAMT_01814 [Methylacidimicrobium tartarophylax]|uniref:Uncharacterized protein n=1 Tax=Methylacidimicrobium tartarophylax TaxID=1041768 RepID=A0A5E6MDG0_9BACT|nr:hypothetical protein MAMT_01814 [Methylacidimicrobium tartarophylax]